MDDLIALLRDGVRRIRQHHAIEHATLHLLAERYPQRTFAGYSDPVGFVIYGEVDSHALRLAVEDALLRLRAGEAQLAIHFNCGTVLASTALLTTVAALLGGIGQRGVLARFSSILMWVLGALVLSKPLGLRLQQYTTLAQVADRRVMEIRPLAAGKLPVHRVTFE
ncbi:MAG: hypothetical protein IT328_04790 [Caldilineaceae bacterium]|nr:hypothetical protein [Caldilineaceae bacterium]